MFHMCLLSVVLFYTLFFAMVMKLHASLKV